MDILANVLDRVRLAGTVLFHYELGRPWNLALPAFPGAVFHYLSRGSATLALQQGRKADLDADLRPLHFVVALAQQRVRITSAHPAPAAHK